MWLTADVTGRSIEISGPKLAELRKVNYWNQQALASKAGISASRVSKIERSRSEPLLIDTFNAIAAAFSMSPGELRSEIGTQKERSEAAVAFQSAINEWDQNVNLATMQRIRHPIPLFSMRVAAGNWVEVPGIGMAPDAATFDQGLFRIRIDGDSMEKTYPNGSVVEFSLMVPGESGVQIGGDYYWHRNDAHCTFKRLEAIDGETLVLQAINRKRYPKAMRVSQQEIVRAARAVALVTLVGNGG